MSIDGTRRRACTVPANPTRTIDFRHAPRTVWTAICHVDDPYKTLVREDGALLYDFDARTWLVYTFGRVVELRLQGEELPRAVSQRTERADSAIVETVQTYDRATLTLRTFRHRRDGRAFDVVQWTVAVHDDVDELLTGVHVDISDRSAAFTSGPHGASPRVFAVDDPELTKVDWWYDAHDPSTGDWRPPAGRVALHSTPWALGVERPTGGRPVFAFATTPQLVAGGDELSGTLVVPLDGDDIPDVDESWSSDALTAERRYWAGVFPDGLPMAVPDTGVQEMLEACARNMLQAREVREGRRVFQVGHTIYRGLWIADGYFLLEAARYLGLDEAADESLRALEAHVADDGSIVALQDVGHIKETAIAMATLVRQAELAGRPHDLDDWWPVLDAAVEHLHRLHRAAEQLPRGSAARDLLPPAFGDGGVAGRRAEYTTILWALAGLGAAAEAARRAGHARAERYAEVRDELRGAFDAHRRQHERRLPDGRAYLPMVLDGGEHHFRVDAPVVTADHAIRPETATWALAHAIWPGEVFDADEAIVSDFLHLLELSDDAEGIPATTGWLPYRALWTYYASFAAHVWLYAGRPDKGIDYLYAFANHASTTRVWREEQSLRGAGHGQINGDMPHNWASAEFIRLVRDLLVFERGPELMLLAGLPAEWTQDGAVARVDATPTRFGRVTLRMESHGEGGAIDVAVERGARTPARVLLHVPPGEWEVRGPTERRTARGPEVVELALAFVDATG